MPADFLPFRQLQLHGPKAFIFLGIFDPSCQLSSWRRGRNKNANPLRFLMHAANYLPPGSHRPLLLISSANLMGGLPAEKR